MPWGKLDDKFHRHAKVRSLRRMRGGREALGCWVYWWSWCLDDPELTGFVPADELPPTDAKAAELLVTAGLWEVVEGGYRFHDFGDYNPKREQLDAKRAADRERIAAKRNASRADVACDNPATAVATLTRVASTRDPVPSRPGPVPSRPLPAERERTREVGTLLEELRLANPSRPGVRIAEEVSQLLKAGGLAAWPSDGWTRDLCALADRPREEFERGIAGAVADPWVAKDPTRATPAHLLKMWPKYSDAGQVRIGLTAEQRANHDARPPWEAIAR